MCMCMRTQHARELQKRQGTTDICIGNVPLVVLCKC